MSVYRVVALSLVFQLPMGALAKSPDVRPSEPADAGPLRVDADPFGGCAHPPSCFSFLTLHVSPQQSLPVGCPIHVYVPAYQRPWLILRHHVSGQGVPLQTTNHGSQTVWRDEFDFDDQCYPQKIGVVDDCVTHLEALPNHSLTEGQKLELVNIRSTEKVVATLTVVSSRNPCPRAAPENPACYRRDFCQPPLKPPLKPPTTPPVTNPIQPRSGCSVTGGNLSFALIVGLMLPLTLCRRRGLKRPRKP